MEILLFITITLIAVLDLAIVLRQDSLEDEISDLKKRYNKLVNHILSKRGKKWRNSLKKENLKKMLYKK